MTTTINYSARRLNLAAIKQRSWYIVRTKLNATVRTVLLDFGSFRYATSANKQIWRETRDAGLHCGARGRDIEDARVV